MKDLLKKQLEELFQEVNWTDRIATFYPSSRIEIIWIMVDWVREGKYIDEGMKIAELYINDTDPTIEDEANKEILKDNEYRGIVSVRGSNAWLIQAIISKLNTKYYPRIITLIEKLAKDPVHYVRTQTVYPISALMVNIRAVKNPDGTDFDFKEEDKKRVINLAFYMLNDNKDYPRILESLVEVFGSMRLLNEGDALSVLNKFVYREGTKFYPDYVLERIVPLVIYYAEFRKDLNDGFNDSKHQEFFIRLMQSAETRIISTIVWLTWKTIEDDPKTYHRLEKYIPYLFERDFEENMLGQYDIFIEKITRLYPKEGVALFLLYLKKVEQMLATMRPEPDDRVWLYSGDMLMEKLAEIEPKSIPFALNVIKNILFRRGYVGDIQKIFHSYKKAPQELHADLIEQIKPIYAQVQNYPFKPALEPLE